MYYIARPVCLSVCLLVTTVSPAKTDTTDRDAVWWADSRGWFLPPLIPCIRWGTCGRHLANMIGTCLVVMQAVANITVYLVGKKNCALFT